MTIDDWEYKRTRQQHFTEAELALIRMAFNQGRKAVSVARELECSTRVIHTHYTNMAAEIPIREMPKAERPARFYRSNFDLCEQDDAPVQPSPIGTEP